jgi:hypothetical protein
VPTLPTCLVFTSVLQHRSRPIHPLVNIHTYHSLHPRKNHKPQPLTHIAILDQPDQPRTRALTQLVQKQRPPIPPSLYKSKDHQYLHPHVSFSSSPSLPSWYTTTHTHSPAPSTRHVRASENSMLGKRGASWACVLCVWYSTGKVG